jgi:quinol monooxygenase YgiN
VEQAFSSLRSPGTSLAGRRSRAKQADSISAIRVLHRSAARSLPALQAKAGSEAALVDALRQVAPPTRAQPGCISFLSLRTDDPAQMLVIQHWESRASHNRNIEQAHIQRFMAAIKDVLADPPGMTWHEVLSEG